LAIWSVLDYGGERNVAGKTDVISRYDTAQEKITGKIRAGVDGPYGAHLSWDDKDR